jgi:hypothetical protein
MKCPHCSCEISSNDEGQYCHSCGASLEKNSEVKEMNFADTWNSKNIVYMVFVMRCLMSIGIVFTSLQICSSLVNIIALYIWPLVFVINYMWINRAVAYAAKIENTKVYYDLIAVRIIYLIFISTWVIAIITSILRYSSYYGGMDDSTIFSVIQGILVDYTSLVEQLTTKNVNIFNILLVLYTIFVHIYVIYVWSKLNKIVKQNLSNN